MSDPQSEGQGGGGGEKGEEEDKEHDYYRKGRTASVQIKNKNNKEEEEQRNNIKRAGVGVDGLAEENRLLRRHLRKQEEKIKLLATKLVRVVGERKNKEKRDEMLIEEQKNRLMELEGVVASLRDKLSVSRHQLATYTKLIPTFPPAPHPSRSSFGSKSKSPVRPTSKRGVGPPSSARSLGPGTSGVMLDGEFTARVEQLLLEAKGENGALEDQLRHSRAHCASLEAQLESSRRHLLEVESAAGEELTSLRSQLEQDEGARRKERGRSLGDNIQLIRLQREARRRAGWCSTLEGQLRGMEEELGVSREKGAWLEGEVARLEEELRAEQVKGLNLGKGLEEAGREAGRVKEVEMRLKGVMEENRILKENHDSLLEKTLSAVSLTSGGGGSRTEIYQQGIEVMELKRQLSGLESALKVEVQAKAEMGEELREERRKCGGLEERVRNLETELTQLRTKLADLEEEKRRIIEKEGSNTGQVRSGDREHLLTLAEEELGQTKWELVQVRDELDKTRSLLRTQMTISKEWGREVEELTKKLDRAENFQQTRLDEFMNLLEQRTNQMVTLELTLESIRPLGTTATTSQQEGSSIPIQSTEPPTPTPRLSIENKAHSSKS